MSGAAPAQLVARALAVEAQAAMIMRALGAAGIDALLLKGPSIERWLYGPGEWRIAADVDLLVAPADFAAAEQRLQAAGFANRYDGAAPAWVQEHADVWRSEALPVPLDLHRCLWGVGAEPARAWEPLWAGHVTLALAGAEVPVLGEGARALTLALHAGHHDRAAGRPLRDLVRALARLEPETWEEAAALAADLDAEGAFADGLSLLPAGRDLLAHLGVNVAAARPSRPEDLWALPKTAEAVVRIGRAQGWREKSALLRAELLPSSGFMRTRAAYGPLARRGAVGLACAHVLRWAHLARDMPAGVRAARRVRRG